MLTADGPDEDEAGKLYDQVVLVVDAMTDARTRLRQVDEAFELAEKRLKTGRGNLVGRVEGIRKLGAKVKKQLPQDVVEEAQVSDAEEEAEEPPALTE